MIHKTSILLTFYGLALVAVGILSLLPEIRGIGFSLAGVGVIGYLITS